MKGGHPAPRDEHAVGEADGAADEQRQGQRRELSPLCDRERGEHGGEGEHRAARQVDAAADDDERHADGDEAQERARLEDVQEVVHAREAGPEGERRRAA